MPEKTNIEFREDYILITISDKVIIPKRTHELLELMKKEALRFGCNKILLDERAVEYRDVPPQKIMTLSLDMPRGVDQIHIAFLCNVNLIDKNSELLRLFSCDNGDLIQHFSDPDQALSWLRASKRG